MLSECVPGCGQPYLTNSPALSHNGIWAQAQEAAIWAHKRLRSLVYLIVSLLLWDFNKGSGQMSSVWISLGGREEGDFKRGLQLIPGYWAGFLGWGWVLCFPNCDDGEYGGMRNVGGFGVSLFLQSPLWGKFHSLGAQHLGIPVHWSKSFRGGGGEEWSGSSGLWGLGPLG